MNLYERLKREHRFYCMGKRPSALKAACTYIEGFIREWKGEGKHKIQFQISMETGVTTETIRKRYHEIMNLLWKENDEFVLFLKKIQRNKYEFKRDKRKKV